MSSQYPNYGVLDVKQVNMSAASGVKFVSSTDDSKSITLKVSGTMGTGNVDIALPVAGDLLTTDSDLDAAQVVGIQNLGQPALHNADVFLFADNSDSHNPKGITAADLATFCGGGGGLPAGTPGQTIVYNGASEGTATTLSGDLTVNASGVTAIGNAKVTNAMLAGSIEYSKLQLSNSLVNNDVSGSAAIAYSKLNLATSVVNADIATNAQIATSKLAAGFNTAGTWAPSQICSVDSNKDATGGRHLSLEGSVDLAGSEAYYLGGKAQDGTWRFRVSGGNLVFERRETGTYVQKGSFSS